jgi:hypothetical protein
MDAAARRRIAAWLNSPAREPLRTVRLGRWTLAPSLGIVGAALGVLLWWLAFATSERFLAHEGLGDDGVAYGAWIVHWKWNLPEMGLSAYNAQRLVAAALVRWLLDVQHLPITNANIVYTFGAVDFVAIIIAWLAWVRACRSLALTRAGWLLGALVAFASFGVLKWIPFDPVLTDALGLAAGSLALVFWLEDRVALLWAVGALGAFVWPGFGLQACVLLALPRPRSGVGPALPERPGMIADALAALFAAGWVVLAWPFREWTPGSGVIYASRSVFVASIIIVGLVLFFGLRAMARPWILVAHARAEGARVGIGVLAAAALWLCVRAFGRWASQSPTVELSQVPDVKMSNFLDMSLFLSVQRPAAFLVAHLVFFGPWIAFALVRWPSVCRAAARVGPGLLAVLGAAFLAGTNSESRRLFAVLPFVAFAVVPGLDSRWSPARLATFAGLTIFGSRVWSTAVQLPLPDLEPIAACEGPWMPIGQYQLALSLLVVGAGWAWHLVNTAVPDDEAVTLLVPSVGGDA